MSGAWFTQPHYNSRAKFRLIPLAPDVNTVGKSTYLRQVGLLTIMGMSGCFVPAEYASFRRAIGIIWFIGTITPRPFRTHDSLLSRLSNDDDMEKSLSTFANEMASCAMILGMCSNIELLICLYIPRRPCDTEIFGAGG